MDGRQQHPEQHFMHRTSYTFQERLVGGFVLLAPLVLLLLFFINSETHHLFEERITLHTLMQNAAGVSRDTPVRISGIEVGRVTAIDVMEDNSIRLTLEIRERFSGMLRGDSRAALGTLSLLGSAAIDVTPGSKQYSALEEGAFIPAQEGKSLDDLIGAVGPTVQQLSDTIVAIGTLVDAVDPQQVSEFITNLNITAGNLRELSDQLLTTELSYLHNLLGGISRDLQRITDQISSGKGSIGRLLFDETMADNLALTLDRTSDALVGANKVLDSLHPLAGDAVAITGNIRSMAASLPDTSQEIHHLVVQLNGLVATLAVEMQQFPKLLTQMKMLVEETDRLLEGVQRIWPISSAVAPKHENLLTIPGPINE